MRGVGEGVDKATQIVLGAGGWVLGKLVDGEMLQ